MFEKFVKLRPPLRFLLPRIGVNPEHRGKRFGKYVSIASLHHLKRRGCDYCTLWTEPRRAAAVVLYQRMGFREIAKFEKLAKEV